MTTKTFSIRPSLLGKVETTVARLNRRAAKLGLDPITYTKTEPYLKELPAEREGDKSVIVNFVDVTLSLNIPKLADWAFVATIQHSDVGNLLLVVPGSEELDLSAYRFCAPTCTHCNLERNRADTYLVRHGISGDLRQVGKQCLSSFTGYGKSPEQAAAFAEWLSKFTEFFSDPTSGESDSEGYGYGASEGYPLVGFLGHVVTVSNRFGFRTRKQAELTETSSTKDDAVFNIDPPRGKTGIPVSDEDLAFAQAAKDWAAGIEVKSDFDHNLKTVASLDLVPHRNLGIAAYIIAAYRRHLAAETERAIEAAKPNAGYLAEEKARVKGLTVTYKGNASFDTQFGTLFIHRFVSDEGHELVWKTTSADGYEFGEGRKYELTATVKAHKEYRGRPQTELSRVKKTAVLS